jgi:hypothetical protein
MGNNLFGARIAEKVGKALGPSLLPVLLKKTTVRPVDPSNLTGPQPSSTRTYTCRGILDTYDTSRTPGTAIQQGSRVVLILGSTLPNNIVPEPDDRVVIEGQTFEIVGPVERDPDAATYTAAVRA